MGDHTSQGEVSCFKINQSGTTRFGHFYLTDLTTIYYENLLLSTELVTEGSIQHRKKYEADVAQVSPSPARIKESCVIIHSKYFSISDWLKSPGLFLHN